MFQLQLPDIFLLSVNQYPMVSLGHVTNCIAEHILEQTASFTSLSFSLSASAFYVNICLYVKTPVDPWVTPRVKNLSFVQCLGLFQNTVLAQSQSPHLCALWWFLIFLYILILNIMKYYKWSRLHDLEQPAVPFSQQLFLKCAQIHLVWLTFF